jgi:hypothetical protein
VSEEKPDRCECCQSQTAELKLYKKCSGSDLELPDCWYCKLCATTMASTMQRHYGQYSSGERQTIQAICFVGNEIIDALRKPIQIDTSESELLQLALACEAWLSTHPEGKKMQEVCRSAITRATGKKFT